MQDRLRRLLASASICACLLSVDSYAATMPKIDVKALGTPKTIVLMDIPKVRNLALIGVYVAWAPGPDQFHFSARADQFFEVGAQPPVPFADRRPSNYGIIGTLIEGKAADTGTNATGISGEILRRFPDYELHADFMKALREAFALAGLTVTVADGQRDAVPRLLWPADDGEGNKYPSGRLDDTPAVDADLLLQVSPIAFYNALGPLNAYKRNVTVGIALYNGRTRQFFGRQTLRYMPADSRFEYSQYAALVDDLPAAAPALREALLSLVPELVEIVSARKR